MAASNTTTAASESTPSDEIQWKPLPAFILPPASAPYDTTFKAVTALWLVSAACLSYETEEVAGRVAKELWGCTRFRFFNHAGTDTQAIGFSNGEFVVVTFRGTESQTDWKTNAEIDKQPFFEDKELAEIRALGKAFPFELVQVHIGFNTAVQSVLPDIEEWLMSAEGGDLEANPARPFYISGHSLGGALATLAFARFTLRREPLHPNGVMTIGQPRCGNEEFAAALNQFGRAVLQRVINMNDVVPGVPIKLHNYRHYGKLVYFDRNGFVNRSPEEQSFDKAAAWFSWKSGFTAHKSALYLDRVQRYFDRAVERTGKLPVYQVELKVHKAAGLPPVDGASLGFSHYYCQLQYRSTSLFTPSTSSSLTSSHVTWNSSLVVDECTFHDIITLNVFGRQSSPANPNDPAAGEKPLFVGQLELPLDSAVNFDGHTYQLWGKADVGHAGFITPSTVTISARFVLLRGEPEQVHLTGKLVLHGATGLKGTNNDPYATIENRHTIRQRTKTVAKSSEPVWEHECPLESINSNDKLQITVLDERFLGDEFLGTTTILLDAEGSNIERQEIPLHPRSQSDEDIAGTVTISLITEPITHAKMVVARTVITVHNAVNLIAGDINGLSDPYVVIAVPRIANEPELTFTTKIVDNTLNPTWEESFTVPKLTLNTELLLRVWDHDTFGADDFLGQTFIRFTSMEAVEQKAFPLTGRTPEESRKITGHVVLSFQFSPAVVSQSSFVIGDENSSSSSSVTLSEPLDEDIDSIPITPSQLEESPQQ